jgi:lactoylglutathione lyase
MLSFGYTIIYVPDVTAAITFYTAAFGLEAGFIDEEGDYAQLQTGATTLAFARDDFAHSLTGLDHHENRANQQPGGFEITFVTDNVQAAVDRAVEHGAELLKAPTQTSWGQTVAYVRDVQGVLVEIATPMGGLALR